MRLTHSCDERLVTVRAAGFVAEVLLQELDFPVYEGCSPRSTWRKPVVGPPHCPFAELKVVADLSAAGWTAAWVYRPGKFISSWEPRRSVQLPLEALALHQEITDRAGARAGCWDVFAWRDDAPLFVELKRTDSSDRVRARQLIWREAALALGVHKTAFIVAEWRGGLSRESRLKRPGSAGRSA